MKSLAATCLTRLRECRDTGRPIPADVIDSTIEALGRVVTCDVLRMQRDLLIRNAGALLAPAPVACKARQLVRESTRLRRAWRVTQHLLPSNPPTTPRDALHAALLIAELPESTRQFTRILQADCTKRG